MISLHKYDKTYTSNIPIYNPPKAGSHRGNNIQFILIKVFLWTLHTQNTQLKV